MLHNSPEECLMLTNPRCRCSGKQPASSEERAEQNKEEARHAGEVGRAGWQGRQTKWAVKVDGAGWQGRRTKWAVKVGGAGWRMQSDRERERADGFLIRLL